MKQQENTSKKLISWIEIIPTVRWVSLIPLLSKMNPIKLWQCIEHVRDFSLGVIIHIYILEWNI